ncbi:TonB family protein [Paludibacterium paludis]|nr:TonB family protein [Paludibacterium paludis]
MSAAPYPGPLWPQGHKRERNTLSYGKAFAIALAIEVAATAAVFGVVGLQGEKKPEEPQTMQVVDIPPPPPPPKEEPKPEPKPEPKVIEKVINKPVPQQKAIKETSPEPLETPKAMPDGVKSSGPTIPTEVGTKTTAGNGAQGTGPVIKGLVPIHKVQPDYPRQALQDEINGEVVAILTVGPDGRVSHVEIKKSSNRIFNNSAKSALMQYRFQADGATHLAEIAIGFNITDAQ